MNTKLVDWSETGAKGMLGKRVLIGLTRVLKTGRDTRQMVGVITAVSANGVEIELEGADAGKTCSLPSDSAALEPASPGDYLLRETGEILADPDFVAIWTIETENTAH